MFTFWLSALAMGWTMIVNPCGCAHVGAFCSTRISPKNRLLTFRMLLSYTFAGIVAGGVTATALYVLSIPMSRQFGLVLFVSAGILCVARELCALPIPLLELRRQTRWRWFGSGPSSPNAAMWALDVGLVFATWLTLSGAWAMAAWVLWRQNLLEGIVGFGVFWLGRSLPHWLDSRLVNEIASIHPFVAQVRGSLPIIRLIQGAAVAVLLGSVVIYQIS